MRKNDWLFWFVFPLVRAASVGHIGFEKIKKFAVFESLNDAYIILMLYLQLINKVKMERIIVFMRNRKSAF